MLKGYLEGDKESQDYAVLLEWDNVYYEKKTDSAVATKSVVRLGLVQWQMRLYNNLDELMQQVQYFVDAVSGYWSDFALFPEFFNAPLMSEYNQLSEPDAIRELAGFTEDIKNRFAELAISYNINIITGSMPEMVGNDLFIVGYLCKQNGALTDSKSCTYLRMNQEYGGFKGVLKFRLLTRIVVKWAFLFVMM